ncbi:MAG: lycopene cyclase domain-containing protein [Candidatus Aenigmatarchaeota archaeon]
MYEYFIFSLILLGIWLAIYIVKKSLRREMLIVSWFTAPVGLTQPLFLGVYWNPSSLFNLNNIIGFDIESIMFSFAIGGIVAVLYESMLRIEHVKVGKGTYDRGGFFHKVAIVSPILIFFPLYFLTDTNPIFSTVFALFIGGVLTIICRRDLAKNTVVGGVLFTVLYLVFFLFVNLADPNFVNYWNLSEITGVLVFGIPLEELLFAFAFGMMWSSVYEHTFGYMIKAKSRK